MQAIINANVKPHATIVGGGFAGSSAARVLLAAGWQVRLITATPTFVFLPLAHEVAAGRLALADISFAYHSFLQSADFELVVQRVKSIDWSQREVLTAIDRYPYDYLLLTTGAKTNRLDWEAAPSVLVLNSGRQAVTIAKRLSALLQTTAQRSTPAPLTVNIIGAGPTGIELSLEVAKRLRASQPTAVVNLFHSGSQLLSWLPRAMGQGIERALAVAGVRLHFNSRVQAVNEQGVVTAQGVYAADLQLLTAGVRPRTGFIDKDHRNDYGEVVVNNYLQLCGQTAVWAAGDIIRQGDKAVPKLAQLAVQQGRQAARNMIRQQLGKPLRPYQVAVRGWFVAAGRRRVAGMVYSRVWSGYLVWLLWRLIYLSHAPGWSNRWRCCRRWLR